MYDLNILFDPVGAHCRRTVITCGPDTGLVDAARLMSEKAISSLVICEDGNPVGIITDRDLRTKVVSQGLDLQYQTVAAVMSRPLITIREDERLFEAMHRIFHHGIHRIVVVDESCKLAGIITDSDILRLQADTPHSLIRSIEHAHTVEELAKLYQQMRRLVSRLFGAGVQAGQLLHFCALMQDEFILRLINLLRSSRFSALTDCFAIVLLGNSGRGEQLLAPGQQSALIYADNVTPAEFQQIVQFSEALAASMKAVGMQGSPAGVNLNNPTWRISLEGFTTLFDQWVVDPTPEHLQKAGILSDMRTVYGDASLTTALHRQITQRLKGNDQVLDRMLDQLLRSKTLLGRFGQLKTVTRQQKEWLDLGHGGLCIIAEGIKALALFYGVQAQSSEERLKWLLEANLLTLQQSDNLRSVFNNLNLFRLHAQVAAIRERRTPDNLLELDQLNPIERGRLTTALEEVHLFRKLLRHFLRFKHVL